MKKCTLAILTLVIILGHFTVGHAQQELQVLGPQNAATLTFESISPNELLVSVLDAENNPILGLQEKDFVIKSGRRTAKIESVALLETSRVTSLNIVLVVDNSYSMERRDAIAPLLSALERFYSVVRSVDNIYVVVFDEKNTVPVMGRNLNVKIFKSSDISQLKTFFNESFSKGLTEGTYLHDGMVAGLDIIKKMPEGSHKFMAVFSDGEDINSIFQESDVRSAAEGIRNFSAYAVDYMPKASADPFLKSFSEAHGGKIWKAASAADLVPIFESFSSTLLRRYVITYSLLNPPEGSIVFEPATLTIEEVTAVESAPLLNQIFFDTGSSRIPSKYVTFSSQSDTSAFSEQDLRGSLEKYYHVLNIIGRRLEENPDAQITVVGCNSDIGEERGKLDLSRSRAEAVAAYLKYIWGIDPSRMKTKAQGLPDAPSRNTIPEGRVENQRAEIHSDHPAILDTIKSTYVEEMSKTKAFRILPQIQSEAGIASWKLTLLGDGAVFHTLEGEGPPPGEILIDLDSLGLHRLVSLSTITPELEVTDKDDQAAKFAPNSPIPVDFIKRAERVAEKRGYKVMEKYALILFDFDSSVVKDRNALIVEKIIARMRQLPSASVKVIGHTDNIGKENYNLSLSERRAKAVFESMLVSGMAPGEDVTYAGVGPFTPLYDNSTPEGRALNRTVTVTLEYEKAE